MPKKRRSPAPEDRIVAYEKLIATIPEIELKGATMMYTSFNGNMFSYLSKEGAMALRLGKDDREEFMKRYDATLDKQYGSVMKEYVRVPDDVVGKTRTLKPWLTKSWKYVQALKAKPTTRKKK